MIQVRKEVDWTRFIYDLLTFIGNGPTTYLQKKGGTTDVQYVKIAWQDTNDIS